MQDSAVSKHNEDLHCGIDSELELFGGNGVEAQTTNINQPLLEVIFYGLTLWCIPVLPFHSINAVAP